MFSLLSNPISFLLYFVSLVVAITIHEFAHAWAAEKLGDPTPRLQGRLTLNPLAHLDPLGTLMLILVHFGWGKPVQFDPFNLRNPQRDAAIISLAGPASNVTLAFIAAVLLRILQQTMFLNQLSLIFLSFLQSLIVLNLVLAVFNLIPIHPLDGFKIVGGFLSPAQAREWYSLERYGMIFLIFLLFPLFGPAPISLILGPVLNFLLSIFIPGQGNFI